MEHKRFDSWHMQNVSYRIEVKPVEQSFESFNSEVKYFLLCAVSWMLKSIPVTWPNSRVSELQLIQSNVK